MDLTYNLEQFLKLVPGFQTVRVYKAYLNIL